MDNFYYIVEISNILLKNKKPTLATKFFSENKWELGRISIIFVVQKINSNFLTIFRSSKGLKMPKIYKHFRGNVHNKVDV